MKGPTPVTLTPSEWHAWLAVHEAAEAAAERLDCDCDGAPDGGGTCVKHLAEEALKRLDAAEKKAAPYLCIGWREYPVPDVIQEPHLVPAAEIVALVDGAHPGPRCRACREAIQRHAQANIDRLEKCEANYGRHDDEGGEDEEGEP